MYCFCVFLSVVALWEAFFIENKRFDLDTLGCPSGSPPRLRNPMISQDSPTISGGLGAPISDRFWEFPGSGPAYKKHIFSPLKRPPRQP